MEEIQKKTEVDVYIENHGSLFLVRPVSPFAAGWMNEKISEDAQYFGNALAVEPRYVADLVEGMKLDGLVVL